MLKTLSKMLLDGKCAAKFSVIVNCFSQNYCCEHFINKLRYNFLEREVWKLVKYNPKTFDLEYTSN